MLIFSSFKFSFLKIINMADAFFLTYITVDKHIFINSF